MDVNGPFRGKDGSGILWCVREKSTKDKSVQPGAAEHFFLEDDFDAAAAQLIKTPSFSAFDF